MHIVRAVVSAVERTGEGRASFLARSGLTREQLEHPEAWLPVSVFRRVVDTACEMTGDPALGLHLGEQARSVMFQLLAHLVEHAPTLGEAIEMIVRYTGLLAQGFEPQLVRLSQHRVALRFPWLCGDAGAVRVMADLAMSGLERMLEQYVGTAAGSAHVCFASSAPQQRDEYRRVFSGRAHFAQPYTELQFPEPWLRRKQLHGNRVLHDLFRAHAEHELLRQAESSWSARVAQLLSASDPRELPALPSAARALGVSPRTLTRRLGEEHTAYADLILQRRRSAAQELLQRPGRSLREVAEAMGYADAQAFHKAFKRWAGLTPMQYLGARTR